LASDSVESEACEGPEPSWLRKSMVSGSEGLGEPRDPSSWPTRSMVSGPAGLGGLRGGSSWLRKSMVSGSEGLGGSRDPSSWPIRSMVSGSVGRGGSELDGGRSSVDWCGAVDGERETASGGLARWYSRPTARRMNC